jgi:hypothetical protein
LFEPQTDCSALFWPRHRCRARARDGALNAARDGSCEKVLIAANDFTGDLRPDLSRTIGPLRLIGSKKTEIGMPVSAIRPIRLHAAWPIALRSLVPVGRLRDQLGL